MATKLEKCAKAVNAAFAARLAEAFKAKFARELETRFNIFSMELYSKPADDEPFTQEQHDFVAAWSDGYGEALEVVRAQS